jgi:hypothetical protein
MITYTVSDTETETVYDIKSANMCLGPCPCVYIEGYRIVDRFEGPMTASGCFKVVQEKVWDLKPLSGGSYTLHYPSPSEAYGYDGPRFVFKGMRICRTCNSRYLELSSEMAYSDNEQDRISYITDMAQDCMRIVQKLEKHATCLNPALPARPASCP